MSPSFYSNMGKVSSSLFLTTFSSLLLLFLPSSPLPSFLSSFLPPTLSSLLLSSYPPSFSFLPLTLSPFLSSFPPYLLSPLLPPFLPSFPISFPPSFRVSIHAPRSVLPLHGKYSHQCNLTYTKGNLWYFSITWEDFASVDQMVSEKTSLSQFYYGTSHPFSVPRFKGNREVAPNQ